jgi:hypothetical protein
MTLAEEYHEGYRSRLGRVMLNPFDLDAFMDWLRWTANNPGVAGSWSGRPGGAA